MSKYTIAGLGVTEQGIIPNTSSDQLTWDAIELALADAGIERRSVNGYVFQPGFGEPVTGNGAARAGLGAHSTLEINSSGATANLALSAAIGLIESGTAEYVMCTHATNARSQRVTVGADTSRKTQDPYALYGFFSPGAQGALMAQTYLHKYDRDTTDLAEVAVALRTNAENRDDAYMSHRPISVDDHQASRFIVRPLRLLDYCLVTDGAIAFLVTTAERACDLKARPVHILGLGATHDIEQAYSGTAGSVVGPGDLNVDSARARALNAAGLVLDDINVFQFYDAFTIMVLLQIEAYGLCRPGEAGDWIRAGNFRWDSKVPCNTSGTLHSWGYVQGFTHIAEAVRQLRGEAGATQVPDACTALVTNVGITGSGMAQSVSVLGAYQTS